MIRRTVLVLTLLTAAALGLRIAAADTPADGARVLPFPDDPPYHLVRVQRMLAGPVGFADPDPLLVHPDGAVAHWPWGFDLGLEGITRAFATPGDDESARRAMSLAIAVLGALLVPLGAWLASRVMPWRRAWLAAALLAVLPYHVQYTQAGRIDHHVLEPILTVIAAMGVLALPGSPVPAVAWAIVAGLLGGAAFGIYPAALHPVLATLGILGSWVALRRPREASAWALAMLLGTFASRWLSPHPDEWVFYSPSWLQVALVGIVTAGVLCVAASSRVRRPGPAWARLGLGAGVAAACALATALAFPPLPQSVLTGLAYLGSRDFAKLSLEASPLLSDAGQAVLLAGIASPLAIPGLALLALGRAGGNGRDVARPVGLLGLALVAVALAQRRFVLVATPFLAVGTAEALAWLGGKARDRLAATGVRPLLPRLGQAVLVAGILVSDGLQAASTTPWTPQDQAMLAAADGVRRQGGGTGGALVPWSYGHLFQWAAGTPTVCDNFFGNPDSDRGMRECLGFLYEEDPAKARARLLRNDVRWVVLLPPHPDQVRVEAPLIGQDPGRLVDGTGRLTPAFAATAWARLGRFAQQAEPGDPGPLGLAFRDRIVRRAPATGEAEAEVLVFERIVPPAP